MFSPNMLELNLWRIKEKVEQFLMLTDPKAHIFKVSDRVRITKHANIFSKDTKKNWSKEIFVIDSVLKTNPLAYKVAGLNGETIIKHFYEKELLLNEL